MIGVVDDKKDFIFQFSDQWRDSGGMGQIFYIFYLGSGSRSRALVPTSRNFGYVILGGRNKMSDLTNLRPNCGRKTEMRTKY
jgi:hypothetical protein